ncbi:fatty acid desaturase [Bosea sp. PAMC 26642]|nr:fatty acid desaturase [Bosea sp. PAMC 26642]
MACEQDERSNSQFVARRRKIEWPTIALAALIYGSWLALTYFHALLPSWFVAAAGAWLVAWHSSLQHEILHGHPTRSRTMNRLIASWPISLWLPYESYRVSHLRHHNNERLTDPLDDPESRYVTTADWEALGPAGRWLLRIQKTLFGRLTIGPAWSIIAFLVDQARGARRGDAAICRAWLQHLPMMVLVVIWLVAICEMDLWFYGLAIVYPATSLMLLRSFAEHKAADGVLERTAIVENAPILGLLYLYNNLHAAHHECPTMPWYEIPRWYQDNRDRLVMENGGMVYDGYIDVVRRFLLRAHDPVVHPLNV